MGTVFEDEIKKGKKIKAQHFNELKEAISSMAKDVKKEEEVSVSGYDDTPKVTKAKAKTLQDALNKLENLFSLNCCQSNCCQTDQAQQKCQSVKNQGCQKCEKENCQSILNQSECSNQTCQTESKACQSDGNQSNQGDQSCQATANQSSKNQSDQKQQACQTASNQKECAAGNQGQCTTSECKKSECTSSQCTTSQCKDNCSNCDRCCGGGGR